MQKIITFLEENNIGFFATVEDGQPRVRPWQFQFEMDGKFYFCTSNNKAVFRQLQATPYAAFASLSKTMATVRLSGEVVFDDGQEMRNMLLDRNQLIKDLYGSAENPLFTVFYLCNGKASYTEFGKNPEEYSF